MKPVKIEKDTFIKLMTFVKTWFRACERKSQMLAGVLYNKSMLGTKVDLAYTIEDIISDPEMRDVLIDIIVDAMDDNDNEWIYYYIYELEWGEKNDQLKVYKEDKVTEIPLTTLEDLWNILVNSDEQ